jgi:hypothetical protein
MNNPLKQYKSDNTKNHINGIEIICSYSILTISGKEFYFFTNCRPLSFEDQGHRFLNKLYPLYFYTLQEAYQSFCEDLININKK